MIFTILHSMTTYNTGTSPSKLSIIEKLFRAGNITFEELLVLADKSPCPYYYYVSPTWPTTGPPTYNERYGYVSSSLPSFTSVVNSGFDVDNDIDNNDDKVL